MFKGSLSASIQENHQFFVKNGGIFQALGIASFTKSSLSIIYNKNRKYLNGSIFSSLPSKLNNNDTIFDLPIDNLDIYITKFNKAAAQFESAKTSISSFGLINLINYHENVQFNSKYTKNETLDNLIIDINNSLEKCVTIKFSLLESNCHIELSFYERGNRSNERKIAIQNQLTFVAQPSTPTGQTYSQNTTSDFQKSSVSNQSTIISRPQSKDYNPQDAVAAPLQMFYDNNTNTFKSGNVQILARLLTDVDPAPIQSLDGANFNNLQEILEITSGFSTGKALPLSVQNGNPYSFGPTYIECLVKNKIELDVVNRSLRAFAADTVVILTEINGEWIIQDFGENSVPLSSPINFGDWSFFKYIANTDSYFKDARYYDQGTNQYLTDIKPEIYEEESRKQFYTNILSTWSNSSSFIQDNIERPSLSTIYGALLKEIVKLNIGTSQSTFIPSVKFYVGSIFDQLHSPVGGYSETTTLLEYVNILDTSAFDDPLDIAGVFSKPRKFKTFWGAAYQDGFKTFSYNVNGKDNNNDLGFFQNVTWLTDFGGKLSLISLEKFNSAFNTRLFNIPAEVGGIFINPLSIFQNWNNLGKSNFIIKNQYVHSPYYGTSEPISKNKLQFSPLYAEMVGDTNIDIANRQARIKNELFPSSPDSVNLLGNLLDRSKTFGFDDVYDVPPGPFVRIEDNVKQTPNSLGGNTVRSFSPWDNAFGTTPYQGAFCVGVISAKQTISKRGGGDLNFSTNQIFGRHTFDRIGGGVQSGVTFLGLGVGMTAVGFGNQLAPASSSPTWGSRTDNISSFGTTALHVRIFDHWPEDQTLFDPRYFSVLHFNPGSYYDPNGVLFTKTGETEEQLNKRISEAKNLDIPIPTKIDDSLLILGTVNKDTTLKPKNQWKLNPIRRGVLLSGGGFKYKYTVIGLYPQSSSIIFGGTGFINNFEYIVQAKNVKFNFIVSGGKITSWTFVKDDLDNELIGDNFLPEDFNSNTPIVDENGNVTGSDGENKGFILNIPSQTSGGKAAIIKFSEGIAWLKIAKDDGPSGGNITRLSKGSQAGQARVISGGQDTVITLERNSSGQYDCFYHFHNDISHTLAYEYNAMPAWLQYINLTIT